jgi:hypothetical protein
LLLLPLLLVVVLLVVRCLERLALSAPEPDPAALFGAPDRLPFNRLAMPCTRSSTTSVVEKVSGWPATQAVAEARTGWYCWGTPAAASCSRAAAAWLAMFLA